MKRLHRKLHRYVWLFLLPALLLLTLLLSNTHYETLPINAEVPGYGAEQDPALVNRKIQ